MKTKQCEAAFSLYAPHPTNKRPEYLRSAKTVSSFKSRLKGIVYPKVKIQSLSRLLTLTLMEGQVKFCSPQHARVSPEKAVAVISRTIAVNGDQDSNIKKIHYKIIKNSLHTARPMYAKCPEASTWQVVLKHVTDAMFAASLFTGICSCWDRSHVHMHARPPADKSSRQDKSEGKSGRVWCPVVCCQHKTLSSRYRELSLVSLGTPAWASDVVCMWTWLRNISSEQK